jgi:CRP-like cAMP-binding protein
MAELPLAERIAILKDNEGWFGRAPAAYQDAVLERCDWRHYPAGSPIYRAVDEHADMFGMVDGTAEFYSRFGTGDNPLLHLTHEGHWLGTASVLAQGPPRVTALARVDSLVARVPYGVLNELLDARPEWWRVQGTAGLEYGDLGVSAFVDSLISDNERRFACTLLRIAGLRPPRRSRPAGASVPITQGELAEMVNVSRTTLLEILRRLERQGVLEQGYRTLRVLDVAALETIAALRPPPRGATALI